MSFLVLGLAWLDNFLDTRVVNSGFDGAARASRAAASFFRCLQSGRIQGYLRVIGVALIALVIFLLWGAKA